MNKELTIEIAEEFLLKNRLNPYVNQSIDLTEFTSINDTAAEKLAKFRGDLFLNGLTTLSDVAAEVFGKHEGGYLGLNGLTSITDLIADALSNHNGGLELNGVQSLSEYSALKLGEHKRDLWLNGLNSISKSIAEGLSKHEGFLCLYGIKVLTDSAAEGFEKHMGTLYLNGLTSISDTAAKSLGKHKGHLSLNGLTSLSDVAAEGLGYHEGDLDIEGLMSISDLGINKLISFKERSYYTEIIKKNGTKININQSLIDRVKNLISKNLINEFDYNNKSKSENIKNQNINPKNENLFSDKINYLEENINKPIKIEFISKPVETAWKIWYNSEVLINEEKYSINYFDSDETEDIKVFDRNGQEIDEGTIYDSIIKIFNENSAVFKDAEKGDTFINGENDKW